jgi:hypothetical protein
MKIPELTKSAAAAGLTGVAKVLRTGADAVGGMAALIKPGKDARRTPDERPGRAAGTVTADDIAAADPGRVKEASRVDVPGITRVSAAPTHTAEMAEGTVAEVVKAIDGLSTDELRLLLEHESATKKRKGVLDAIEQALAP